MEKTNPPKKRGPKPKPKPKPQVNKIEANAESQSESKNANQDVESKLEQQIDTTELNSSIISTDMLPPKKKRGRKPKPKDDSQVKIPKKRGRKPKEIYKPIETNKIVNNEEAVILHLNIKNSNSNLNVEDQFITYNPQINIPKPYTPDEFDSVYHLKTSDKSNNLGLHSNDNNLDDENDKHDDNIHGNHDLQSNNECINANISSNKIDMKIKPQGIEPISTNITNNDIFDKFNQKNIEYSENLTSDKNKSISIFTEFSEANKSNSWPTKTNIDCLWCCFSFTNAPYGIPIRKIQDTYQMFGNFCSPSCAASYIFEMKYLNEAEKLASYSMLNYLYKDANSEGINFAPSKLCLKKFGGRLSIEQYRNIVSFKKKELNVLIPPLMSIIPNVEETNITNNLDMISNSNLNSSRISKSGEILRLKRSKPLPDSNNTLESCMNLKLL